MIFFDLLIVEVKLTIAIRYKLILMKQLLKSRLNFDLITV